MLRTAFAVLVVQAALAGCGGPVDPAARPAAPPPGTPQGAVVLSQEMRLDAGVTVTAPGPGAPWATHYWVERAANPPFAVFVAPGATALLVEMWWHDPADALLLQVMPPSYTSPVPPPDRALYDRADAGTRGDPLRVEVAYPAVGEWAAEGHADPVAADAVYHLHATVFYDGAVPPGYSAVPAR